MAPLVIASPACFALLSRSETKRAGRSNLNAVGRFLVLILSLCLASPPPALAFRFEQIGNDPNSAQLSGLEEALKTGLEEDEKEQELRSLLDRLRDAELTLKERTEAANEVVRQAGNITPLESDEGPMLLHEFRGALMDILTRYQVLEDLNAQWKQNEEAKEFLNAVAIALASLMTKRQGLVASYLTDVVKEPRFSDAARLASLGALRKLMAFYQKDIEDPSVDPSIKVSLGRAMQRITAELQGAGIRLDDEQLPSQTAGLEEDERADAELEKMIRQARGPIQAVVLAERKVAVFVDPFLTQAPVAELEKVDQFLDGLNRYPVIDVKPLDPKLMKQDENDGFWVIQLKLEPKARPAEETYDTVYVRLPKDSDRLPFVSELPLLITNAVAHLQEAEAKRPTDGKPLILLMDLPAPSALDVDEASRAKRILKALHDSFA